MKKLTLSLAAAALALGAMALSANAQQLGAGHAQLQNATPIVKQVACRGFGPHCGPGFVWTCGPYRPLLVPPLRLSGPPGNNTDRMRGRLCAASLLTVGRQFSGRPLQ